MRVNAPKCFIHIFTYIYILISLQLNLLSSLHLLFVLTIGRSSSVNKNGFRVARARISIARGAKIIRLDDLPRIAVRARTN